MGRLFYLLAFISFVAVITAIELDEAIRGLEKSFRAYDVHIDKAVPWTQLKSSIEALDNIKAEYTGQLVSDINNVIYHTNQILDQYKTITHRLFSWAAEAYTTFSFIKGTLNNFAPEVILSLSRDLINTGFNLFANTLTDMESISGNLTDIKKDLSGISTSLHKEMEDGLKKFDDASEKNRKINQQVDELIAIVKSCEDRATMKWYDWIASIISPLGAILNSAAVEKHHHRIRHLQTQINDLKHEFDGDAKIENKIKMTTFFKILTESVDYAEKNVTAFKEAIDAENDKLGFDLGSITAHKNIILKLKVEHITLTAQVFKQISDLLEEYVVRHGGERIKFHRQRRSIGFDQVADLRQQLHYVRNELETTARDRDTYFWTIVA